MSAASPSSPSPAQGIKFAAGGEFGASASYAGGLFTPCSPPYSAKDLDGLKYAGREVPSPAR
jgi:hypothetical protein